MLWVGEGRLKIKLLSWWCYWRLFKSNWDPQLFDAYRYRGDSKISLNDYEGAIEDYSKAIEINPQCYLGLTEEDLQG